MLPPFGRKGGILVLDHEVSTFNDSRQHHLMLGADGFGILIGCTGKGNQILSDMGQLREFIHQAMFGTIRRSGIIIIFLNQLVHIIDNRLKGSTGIFFLYQPA